MVFPCTLLRNTQIAQIFGSILYNNIQSRMAPNKIMQRKIIMKVDRSFTVQQQKINLTLDYFCTWPEIVLWCFENKTSVDK